MTSSCSWRLAVLKEHGLGLKQIQQTIAAIDPLPGAEMAFLDALRRKTQVVILSDTFEEFAMPLMEKLGWPIHFLQQSGGGAGRGDHGLQNALRPVQTYHGKGPSVHGL